MKYQCNILKEVIKKSLKYLLFFYILVFLDLFLFFVGNHAHEEIVIKLMTYLFIPTLESIKSIHPLIFLYQFIFFLYFIVSFITYEKKASAEFTALRLRSKQFFLSKFCCLLLFFVFYFLFYGSFLFLFFGKIVFYSIFLFQYILYVFSLFIFLACFFISTKQFVYKLLLLVVGGVISIFFPIGIVVISSLIFFLLRFVSFSLKQFYNQA